MSYQNIMDLFKQIEGQKESSGGPITYLVVGLGNPGKEYAETRHNVGFRCIDYLAETLGAKVDRAKFHALVGEATIGAARVLLVKPQTYMNLSGTAVAEAARFYKLPPERVVVLYDDISLEPGRIRIRAKGSDGGHNGVRSIIAQLGSDAFPRVKIGVGAKPCKEYDLADWVLGTPNEEAKKKIAATYPVIRQNLSLVLSEKAGDFEKAVQACNGFRA